MPPSPSHDWSERSRELSQLLARSGLGDRAAFATLYEKSSSHLFAVVLRICRDRAIAEDILQEVYVNVWRAATGFDAAQSQPLTWLTSIARNRAIDSLRRAQTQPQLQTLSPSDDEDTDVYDDKADDQPGPLELLSRASDARALSHCMQDLT
ncbi:MAG TPA: sigma-70 family RNA polymerase sigma factor, partial [Albitalea sp.]|nr:sigma-70 family RNA polymerase sigma factor [Albitalea sp.]